MINLLSYALMRYHLLVIAAKKLKRNTQTLYYPLLKVPYWITPVIYRLVSICNSSRDRYQKYLNSYSFIYTLKICTIDLNKIYNKN
ncbi:hypothetical protein SASC598J21_000550 [Snodgrassella alvi SCGC AB-598-J21]|uniref:Uncharacterized protein n=1 Tax=Snodgrassella alvi SCGC AB-598-J21 TaxID=1385367 RepID=A0A074VEE4_9NEIS|nr:hypothetical protein SASC598J21_000550 [Snodgrassella alvi SCGC AB-598-J21]